MKLGFLSEAVDGDRLERWRNAKPLTVFVADEERVTSVSPHLQLQPEPERPDEVRSEAVPEFIESARELVFDASGPYFVFHIVGYYLDTQTLQVSVGVAFQILIDDDDQAEREREIG